MKTIIDKLKPSEVLCLRATYGDVPIDEAQLLAATLASLEEEGYIVKDEAEGFKVTEKGREEATKLYRHSVRPYESSTLYSLLLGFSESLVENTGRDKIENVLRRKGLVKTPIIRESGLEYTQTRKAKRALTEIGELEAKLSHTSGDVGAIAFAFPDQNVGDGKKKEDYLKFARGIVDAYNKSEEKARKDYKKHQDDLAARMAAAVTAAVSR